MLRKRKFSENETIHKRNMLESEFPKLHRYLNYDLKDGIYFRLNLSLLEPNSLISPPKLKYYFVDESTKNIICHNLRWAKGIEKRPRFQFIYLMLPNKCNQKCIGCFTGQDKSRLPEQLNGDMYSEKTLEMIFAFLKEHDVKIIVYGGGGELFIWTGAFNYIDNIHRNGFNMVIFTNGTLLTKEKVKTLNQYEISLIVSIRDTIEAKHNKLVRFKGFRSALKTVEFALEENMHKANRLAIEIPVTKDNEKRILNCLLPALRSLNIVPLIEEYIQISISPKERDLCHTFDETRRFFLMANRVDKSLGYKWDLQYGQRMLAQPKCQRSLYSFAIYPNGDVMDCPSHSVKYGNIYQQSLEDIIYSEKFRKNLLNFSLCPCSVFYTNNPAEVPKQLPTFLEALR